MSSSTLYTKFMKQEISRFDCNLIFKSSFQLIKCFYEIKHLAYSQFCVFVESKPLNWTSSQVVKNTF